MDYLDTLSISELQHLLHVVKTAYNEECGGWKRRLHSARYYRLEMRLINAALKLEEPQGPEMDLEQH